MSEYFSCHLYVTVVQRFPVCYSCSKLPFSRGDKICRLQNKDLLKGSFCVQAEMRTHLFLKQSSGLFLISGAGLYAHSRGSRIHPKVWRRTSCELMRCHKLSFNYISIRYNGSWGSVLTHWFSIKEVRRKKRISIWWVGVPVVFTCSGKVGRFRFSVDPEIQIFGGGCAPIVRRLRICPKEFNFRPHHSSYNDSLSDRSFLFPTAFLRSKNYVVIIRTTTLQQIFPLRVQAGPTTRHQKVFPA